MQNDNDDTIKTSDTVLLEKYTSHFIWKGCVWEGVEDRTKLRHIDPYSYGYRISFPFCWAAQPGAWGPASLGAGFLYRILSLTGLVSKRLNRGSRGSRGPFLLGAGYWLSLPHLVSNRLNFLCTVLYNSSTLTFFLWASQIALIQPIHGQGYTMLFLDRMHQLFA